MGEIRAASRAERQRMIFFYMVEQYKKYDAAYVTAFQIAKGIGMNPRSPQFRQHLRDAVNAGLLIMDEVPNPGKWKTYGYKLSASAQATLLPQKRSIPIKKNGVVEGQLRLF